VKSECVDQVAGMVTTVFTARGVTPYIRVYRAVRLVSGTGNRVQPGLNEYRHRRCDIALLHAHGTGGVILYYYTHSDSEAHTFTVGEEAIRRVYRAADIGKLALTATQIHEPVSEGKSTQEK
jgi:hypothetical protein